MAIKKVYPFIHAMKWDNGGNVDCQDVVFDAREVESYSFWELDDDDEDDVPEEDKVVTVHFKSGNEVTLYRVLDQLIHPGDDLITRINKVQHSHFWHDNEDSLPDENEKYITTATF